MTIKKLDSIRDQIAALVDERDETADAAITREEAAARFDHLIARVQADHIMGMGPGALRDGGAESTIAVSQQDRHIEADPVGHSEVGVPVTVKVAQDH